MDAWDEEVFAVDGAIDFLDELTSLDDDDIEEAVADATKLLLKDPHVTDDDVAAGRAAATIAAIWAGAPYSAGAIVEDYPFIRDLIGRGDEELYSDACRILEDVDTEADIDPFIEALTSVE